jgi:hypothetical protein
MQQARSASGDGEHLSRHGDPLELVGATVHEVESRAGDEIADGAIATRAAD